jgi:1,4-alpha-glucan branching enzyme
VRTGHLAIVLHAHLPFVRHPEHEEFFEEDWFFEAISETYIPLIRMMQRLLSDGVPFKLTMSITPPLCAMLDDELLRGRYVRHLERTIRLAQREIDRNREHSELRELAQFYCESFSETLRLFEMWNRDLVAAFRDLRDAGALEIVACAATHGVLPVLAPVAEAMRAQIAIGRDVYRRSFQAEPSGFWLPECAYAPGVERLLQEANVRWFIVDAHALAAAKPRPRRAIFAPCFTADGPAVFARDPDSSRQVWSAESGYPGDPAYREFYRDVGFDLPPQAVFPESTTKTPRFTGLKYHRITGRDTGKQLYDPAWAESAAHAHAEHFLESRRQQLQRLGSIDFDPIIVMPFDAELFGHWWYEGPLFLESFIRKTAAHPEELRLTTPTDYLAAQPTQEVVSPAASSWGDGGYWAVWLEESNAWIYPHLHAAARQMVEAARRQRDSSNPLVVRVLQQLARELLLAQSSDWAFLIRSGTAKGYATKRTTDHLTRFNSLREQLTRGEIDERFLADCEWRDNIFPEIEWRHYL